MKRLPKALLLAMAFSFSMTISAKNPPISTTFGIDVSHHQGRIDWKGIADSKQVAFVYIKATEGGTFVDGMYKTNEKKAKDNGLLVGGYHFFSEKSSAKAQFENFSSTCRKGKTDLIPMIDVEPRGKLPESRVKSIQKTLVELVRLIEKHYGVKPLLYCSVDVYNICIKPVFDESYPVCIGHPYEKPPVLKGKKCYDLWQFTYSGKIDGVPGTFDMHKFNKHTDINCILLNPRKGSL